MKIRALTGFVDPGWPFDPRRISHVAKSLMGIKENMEKVGYEVQSLRLACPPPSEIIPSVPPTERPGYAQQLEAECFVHGIDYSAIGPVLSGDEDGFEQIPVILQTTESVFASALYAHPEGELSLSTARACAEVIQQISTITPDGFTNLRFAALANVPSGSPFFPAAYHRGGPAAVAIATEAADLAVTALQENSSPQSASRVLIETIEGHAAVLSRIAQPIAAQENLRYWGIDFSFAPFPGENCSFGSAMLALGIPQVGMAGSAATASFIAYCLDQAQFQKTGFCGLFFPVLEDSVLAKNAAEGTLTIKDLLLYATICGTGLDTVPLPGDVSVEALYALLLDLGALSLRHDKPLTARLMPIPNKNAGDDIHFDFPYFADSKVLSLDAQALSGALANASSLDIGPHGGSRGAAPFSS